MASHWIQGAIKHPGALHKSLGVPMGQKIPAKKLSAAAAKGGKIGQRARLAQTLEKMHHSPKPFTAEIAHQIASTVPLTKEYLQFKPKKKGFKV